MNITIFKETLADELSVQKIIQDAFANEEFSDKNEHNLVNALRSSSSFIPELSLIAKVQNKVVGHILFTRARVVGQNRTQEILVLAPLAVSPDYQNNGIGTSLIHHGLNLATELGFTAVSVMGHPTYYKKFGFINASVHNIKAPFEIPDEFFMILELKPLILNGISGTLQYAPEFGC